MDPVTKMQLRRNRKCSGERRRRNEISSLNQQSYEMVCRLKGIQLDPSLYSLETAHIVHSLNKMISVYDAQEYERFRVKCLVKEYILANAKRKLLDKSVETAATTRSVTSRPSPSASPSTASGILVKSRNKRFRVGQPLQENNQQSFPSMASTSTPIHRPIPQIGTPFPEFAPQQSNNSGAWWQSVPSTASVLSPSHCLPSAVRRYPDENVIPATPPCWLVPSVSAGVSNLSMPITPVSPSHRHQQNRQNDSQSQITGSSLWRPFEDNPSIF